MLVCISIHCMFSKTMEFPWHSGKVLDQLNHQRKQGLLCDCTFVVDGVDFKAHKAVLAACSVYFRTLFLEQKDVVHLDISNAAGWFLSACGDIFYLNVILWHFHLPAQTCCVTNYRAVQTKPVVLMLVITGLGQVLEFMYTAKLSLSSQNLEDVLAVANFLQMQEIVNACSAYQSMATPAVSLLTLDFDVGEFRKFILSHILNVVMQQILSVIISVDNIAFLLIPFLIYGFKEAFVLHSVYFSIFGNTFASNFTV